MRAVVGGGELSLSESSVVSMTSSSGSMAMLFFFILRAVLGTLMMSPSSLSLRETGEEEEEEEVRLFFFEAAGDGLGRGFCFELGRAGGVSGFVLLWAFFFFFMASDVIESSSPVGFFLLGICLLCFGQVVEQSHTSPAGFAFVCEGL